MYLCLGMYNGETPILHLTNNFVLYLAVTHKPIRLIFIILKG